MGDPNTWGRFHWRFLNDYEHISEGSYDPIYDIYRLYPGFGCPWQRGAEMAEIHGSCVKMWFEYGKNFRVLYDDKNLLRTHNFDALLCRRPNAAEGICTP